MDDEIELVQTVFDQSNKSVTTPLCSCRAHNDLLCIYESIYDERAACIDAVENFQNYIYDLVDQHYSSRVYALEAAIQRLNKEFLEQFNSWLQRLDSSFADNAKISQKLKNAYSKVIGNHSLELWNEENLSVTALQLESSSNDLLAQVFELLHITYQNSRILLQSHNFRDASRKIIQSTVDDAEKLEMELLNVINMISR